MGANLGDDPAENIRWGALRLLEAGVEELLMAPIIRTKPVDCVPGTPDFLNTAVIGLWGGEPLEHELEKVEHADEKLKALAAKVKAARVLTDEAIALVEAEMKDKTELVARRLVRMQAIVYTSLLMLREVECDKSRMAATVRYVNEMVPEVAMNMEIIKSLKD